MDRFWGKKNESVLDHVPSQRAEVRLAAIKKAAKQLKESVDKSFRTNANRKEDLEHRKKRTKEHELGVAVSSAVNETLSTKVSPPLLDGLVRDAGRLSHHGASTDGNYDRNHPSPLNDVFEKYGQFAMFVGREVANCEMTVEEFWSSKDKAEGAEGNPLAHLLQEEMPAVDRERAKLIELMNRRKQCKDKYENESKTLKKLITKQAKEEEATTAEGGNKGGIGGGGFPTVGEQKPIEQQVDEQRKKVDAASREVEGLEREEALEKDKLMTRLLTLASRENRYATSITEMLKKQKDFYHHAAKMAETQLEMMEKTLRTTPHRPVFEETIEDHLRFSKRQIAAPISLSVSQIRRYGMHEEGIFRIAPAKIKLNKLKAFIDAGLPLEEALVDADSHLYAGLLKCYLRELPIPLLGRFYTRWIEAAGAFSGNQISTGVQRVKSILREMEVKVSDQSRENEEDVKKSVVMNIQYVFKFLRELLAHSQETKMDIHNIGIVFGPNLLWQTNTANNSLPTSGTGPGSIAASQTGVDSMTTLVRGIVENYDAIFERDMEWDTSFDDMEEKIEALKR